MLVREIGFSDIEFKYAMRLALSLSFLSPTNAIELPGANFFGLFNHKFISSIDQLPPKVLRASEYLNPEISALLFPKINLIDFSKIQPGRNTKMCMKTKLIDERVVKFWLKLPNEHKRWYL